MFSRVTINDYLLFLVYALEYRALVMEQMSHEEEVKYLESHPNAADRETGYGTVLLNFCIRDLNGEFIDLHRVKHCFILLVLFLTMLWPALFTGVGLSHLTGKGKQIIEAAINIGLRKYSTVSRYVLLYNPFINHSYLPSLHLVSYPHCSQLPRVPGQVPHGERALAVHLHVVLHQGPARRIVSNSVHCSTRVYFAVLFTTL